MAVALVKFPAETSALSPMAVFSDPVVLLASARYPLAVLKPPVVLELSAAKPLAAFAVPMEPPEGRCVTWGTPEVRQCIAHRTGAGCQER
jgi:hypothetical protein